MKKKVLSAAAAILLFMQTGTAVVSYNGLSGCSARRVDIIGSEYGYNRPVFISENGHDADALTSLTPMTADRNAVLEGASNYPTRFSLYDSFGMTAARDQGNDGLCWAFAGLACAEADLISDGIADTDTDFSEKHLAWFTRGAAASDVNDPMYEDGIGMMIGTDAYTHGGNQFDVISTLARWSGVQTEEAVPYSVNTPLDENQRYISFGHLQDADMFSAGDFSSIKEALLSGKGIYTALYSDTNFFNSDKGTTAYYQELYHNGAANHAVTIVGWDDSYGKENFAPFTPPGDGAWLAKNSWGEKWGDNGLFYLSYYENSISSLTAINMEGTDNYTSVYQYDGNGMFNYYYNSGYVSGANIFTSNGLPLSAASFYTLEADVPYTITVYEDAITSPTDGKLLFTQDGNMTYAGYHTVKFSEEIPIAEGKHFSVVITLKKNGTGFAYDDHSSSSGVSYLCDGAADKNTGWTDISEILLSNVCIKAFTGKDTPTPEAPVLYGKTESGKPVLRWTQADNAVRYEVTRCDVNNGNRVVVYSGVGNSFTDDTADRRYNYIYTVTAYSADGKSAVSNSVSLSYSGLMVNCFYYGNEVIEFFNLPKG